MNTKATGAVHAETEPTSTGFADLPGASRAVIRVSSVTKSNRCKIIENCENVLRAVEHTSLEKTEWSLHRPRMNVGSNVLHRARTAPSSSRTPRHSGWAREHHE